MQKVIDIRMRVWTSGGKPPENVDTHHFKTIEQCAEHYFTVVNQQHKAILGWDYEGFPLFKDEVQELEFTNQIVDLVCTKILEQAERPAGVFGSDKMNQIVEIIRRNKNGII